ncbi:uncharacterized protein L199_003627 [Kwoniella botswanensis]|uniref:uncharacterized protein n=1 Tax=Kwoniella botswanensis TaxID=1268659 RepID=UPI00315D67C1
MEGFNNRPQNNTALSMVALDVKDTDRTLAPQTIQSSFQPFSSSFFQYDDPELEFDQLFPPNADLDYYLLPPLSEGVSELVPSAALGPSSQGGSIDITGGLQNNVSLPDTDGTSITESMLSGLNRPNDLAKSRMNPFKELVYTMPSLFQTTELRQTHLREYHFSDIGKLLLQERYDSEYERTFGCFMQAPNWASEPSGSILRSWSSAKYQSSSIIASLPKSREPFDTSTIELSRVNALGWLNTLKTYYTSNLLKGYRLKRYYRKNDGRESFRSDRASRVSAVISTALTWAFTRFLQIHTGGEEGDHWTGDKLNDQLDRVRETLYIGSEMILHQWDGQRFGDDELERLGKDENHSQAMKDANAAKASGDWDQWVPPSKRRKGK